MDTITVATLAALAVKITTAAKYLTARQIREFVTQLIPWAAGVAIVWLGGQADATADLVMWGAQRLGDLDWASELLAGVALGSGGSLVYDVKKALDNSDTAAEPPLGGGPRGWQARR